jgi:hypothetical protein
MEKGGIAPSNLALHRPYIFSPPCNYEGLIDGSETTKLTDGVTSDGWFWTNPTTMGWAGTNVAITLDLGADCSITGLSVGTAAGMGGVYWPERIFILVSEDGAGWHEVGDLMILDRENGRLPPYGQYATRTISTDTLRTHGRYVMLQILEAGGSCVFLDEVRVMGLATGGLATEYAEPAITDVPAYIDKLSLESLMRDQFTRDLDAVLSSMQALNSPELASKAALLGREIASFRAPSDLEGFMAILPMNDLETRIFRLQAEVWRAQKKSHLRAWTSNRWDPLQPSEEPATTIDPRLEVRLMENERRSTVLNLTNAGDAPLLLTLQFSGLPDSLGLTVAEVLTVGTRRAGAVSAALSQVPKTSGGYRVTVPSGMTRQLWISFKPIDLAARTYAGYVALHPKNLDHIQVPISVTVHPFRFPDQSTLALCGWEYTDTAPFMGVTIENRDALVSYLRENLVNTPWATSASMMTAIFNDDCSIASLDTNGFDQWIARWPNAKYYMVFLAAGDTFYGECPGTARFKEKVGNWIRAWASHLRDLGIQPGRFGLLIHDEPRSLGDYAKVVSWAAAIKAAVPGIMIWEDPQPLDAETPQAMFSAVDVLCIQRSAYMDQADWFRDLFRDHQAQGTELWLYCPDGPARRFDPFSCYLLQEWHCFQIGAKGSGFWSFSDTGSGNCWNEYKDKGLGSYCPFYLDAKGVTGSKFMEAIREGVQDYEYMAMLQSRIEELAAKGVSGKRLSMAKALLAAAPTRVMASENGSNWYWDEKKDRAVQDLVRAELLFMLEDLASIPDGIRERQSQIVEPVRAGDGFAGKTGYSAYMPLPRRPAEASSRYAARASFL